MDITKEAEFYSLVTPDTYYTNVHYQWIRNKETDGNYASEATTTRPYSNITRDRGFVSTACEFDAIDSTSSNELVLVEILYSSRTLHILRRSYEGGEFHLSIRAGYHHTISEKQTKSRMNLFVDIIQTNEQRRVGDTILVFTASGSITYMDDTGNKQMLQIEEFNTNFNMAKFEHGPFARGHHTRQNFLALGSAPLNDQDKEELISFFATDRI